MRRNLVTPVLACLLLLGGITASIGQTTVLNYTNQWSYLVTNALPPGGWTNVSYPAAAGWPVGRAPFAYPNNEGMPGGVPPLQTVLDTNFNGNYVTSYYFRTTFNLPSNPSNLTFNVSALIDDGAVFYVNGRRVQNVRMTTGTVNHNTFATGDGGGDVSARGADTFTIPATNFVQGSNTIAVSVHQNNATSSDMVFGMQITTDVVQPPVIVSQPQSQTVEVGRQATFSVGATGSSLTYRWFANGALVGSQPVYTTPVATLALDGTQYYVIVSNLLGRVQSDTVTLRVVPDTFGPVVTNAFMARSNWVEMRFDEVLDGGPVTNANTLTNFALIHLNTGQKLAITNVFLNPNRRDLQLRLPEVLNFGEYVACAYNMRDATGHVSAANCIGVSFFSTNTFVHLTAGWDYTYLDAPPANWMAVNFVPDPMFWAVGAEGADGPVFQDQVFGGTLCGALAGSPLEALNTTYYFRHTFTIPSGTDLTRAVRLQYLVDDGAVFYLNGTEIHRYNMPQTVITHTTLPSGAQEANCTTGTNFPSLSGLLRIGPNVLAASVHQVNEDDLNRDIVFGVNMSFIEDERTVIPELTITRPNATTVRVSWPTNNVNVSPGWLLQSAPSLTGPWGTNAYTRVGASNVFTTATTNAAFFRMRIH